MATMSKTHLATHIARTHMLTGQQAKAYVEAFFNCLSDAIMQGQRIEIRGFGAWHVTETSARPQARNPKTGEPVQVPARRKVLFRPGQILKHALSQPHEDP